MNVCAYVCLTAGAGGPLRVPYDLLVGADGSSSAVRSEMTAAFPGEYVTEVGHERAWVSGGVQRMRCGM